MSEEQVPDVEEIKERLKIEVEELEEVPAAETEGAGTANVAAELKQLGQQFASTLRRAWESEERLKMESEVREGVKSFAGEIDKAIREMRQSQAAQRIKDEAAQARSKVESTDFSGKARGGLVQGLRWLSVELGNLADQFTPLEKAESPEEGEEEEA